MSSNIYFQYDYVRKLKNRIHKKVYNKKLGITKNIGNEIIVFSNLSCKYLLGYIGKKFINYLLPKNIE